MSSPTRERCAELQRTYRHFKGLGVSAFTGLLATWCREFPEDVALVIATDEHVARAVARIAAEYFDAISANATAAQRQHRYNAIASLISNAVSSGGVRQLEAIWDDVARVRAHASHAGRLAV